MRSADILGRRVLEDLIDDTDAVEAGQDREPPGDGGGLVPADLLKPPQVELDVRALGLEGMQSVVGCPAGEAAKVGLSVGPGLTLVPGEVGSYRQPQHQAVLDGLGQRELSGFHPSNPLPES